MLAWSWFGKLAPMRRWNRFAVPVILILGALPAVAYVGMEGVPPFAFSAWFLEAPRVGHEGRLRVLVGGTYQDTAKAEARIHLPAGMILTSGDTVLAVSGAADPDWVIGLRAAAPGRYEIRGELRVDDMAGGIDEGEWVLPVDVRRDTTLVGSSVAVREERIRGRQRYRYGGPYLVPIDAPEHVIEREIDQRNGKPKVLEHVAAVDSLGLTSGSMSLRFVLFIDSKGSLREARPIGGGSRDARITAAAREALGRWRFAPATTTAGRAVNDWIEVRVEILSPR